jgi:dsRNA-specific ribonuclease
LADEFVRFYRGEGQSIKRAEQDAARRAYERASRARA